MKKRSPFISLGIYLGLLNCIWIYGFALAFASGHHLTLANKGVKTLSIVSSFAILNTLFLLLFRRFKKGKLIAVLLILSTLGYLCFLVIRSIAVGSLSVVGYILAILVFGVIFLCGVRLIFHYTRVSKK